jgi:Icc-related predicted phosphoesterase
MLLFRIFLSCGLLCLWKPCSCFSAISPISRGKDVSIEGLESQLFSPLPPTTTPSMLLVDVENVRGKTNFQQSHEAIVARACAHHASSEQGSNNTRDSNILMVLVMDHGAERTLQTGGPLTKNVGIVFAGPKQKADHVIMDLARSSLDNNTVVVSSDNEVVKACQERAAIVSPLAFIDQLQGISDFASLFPKQVDPDKQFPKSPQQILQKEIAARQELQMIDRLFNPRGKQRKVSRKQRTKLASRQLRAKERLTRVLEDSVAQGGTTLHSAIHSNNTSELESLTQGVEQASRAQIRGGAAETTYERQLLAERLRRRLADAGALTRVDMESNDDLLSKLLEDANTVTTSTVSVGQRFRNPDVGYNSLDGASLGTDVITVRRNHRRTSEPQKPLRILVMSDTHGMEEQLFKFLDPSMRTAFLLPAADVLIHCGDFWFSRSRTMQLDSFFAAQTHIPTKVVIRGNHDPRTPGSVLFPKSRAMYVTKSSTLELTGGIVVGMRPHSRNYNNDALLPPNCDILISHEPPFGILDYTYHDQRAGSLPLRSCVESSADKPALWLCGHIHEGRGATRHVFSTTSPRPGATIVDSTLVINAATANEGKARVLVNGPVLIDVVDAADEVEAHEWKSDSSVGDGSVRLMRPDSLNALVLADKEGDDSKETEHRCLLAVDLGLRTGTAVFDRNGTVLAVDTWRFHDPESLDLGLKDILTAHNITHVVIEGEDRKLFYIWRRAIEKFEGVQLARVVADDWRRMLLSKKEMRDARKAKSAAGLIAKQVLKDNEDLRDKKLSSDAAEALLVGRYAVRVLGWITSKEPPVKRYTNGDVAR